MPTKSQRWIRMVDLESEYRVCGQAVEDAVLTTLRSQQFVLGAACEAFEAQFAEQLDCRHAVGVGSGTEALILCLKALGVGAGDEVITSPFTFFATVEAIQWVGARPVFADIESGGFLLDPSSVKERIGLQTKAIIPVHLFGHCADIDGLRELVAGTQIAIIEDAAQAFGARRDGVAAGKGGTAGCFSFYPSKNLGAAGDGGCITTDRDELAEALRLLRTHGVQAGLHCVWGTTSRLDALQAAVLTAKLPYLEEWNQRRAEHAEYFQTALQGYAEAALPTVAAKAEPAWNQYVIRVSDPQGLQTFLLENSIESRRFYERPVYQQPVFPAAWRTHDCPRTERLCEQVLSIPVHPWLTSGDRQRIVERVGKYLAAA